MRLATVPKLPLRGAPVLRLADHKKGRDRPRDSPCRIQASGKSEAFGNALGLQEQLQVVAATCLAIRTALIEPAKGLNSD